MNKHDLKNVQNFFINNLPDMNNRGILKNLEMVMKMVKLSMSNS